MPGSVQGSQTMQMTRKCPVLSTTVFKEGVAVCFLIVLKGRDQGGHGREESSHHLQGRTPLCGGGESRPH